MKNFVSFLIICLTLTIALPASAGICDIKKPGNYTPSEVNKNGVVRDNSYNENNLARLEAAYDNKYLDKSDPNHWVDRAPLDAHRKEVTDPYYSNYRN